MTEPFCIETLRERLRARTPRTQNATQRASVALLLGIRQNHLHLMFIQRAEHPSDPWSGHMALPGGRRDPSDSSDLATAIRETREEVGLDLTQIAELLGELDTVRATVSGRGVDMVIAPFVFYVKSLSGIVISEEVVAAHWVPVAPLFDGSAASEIRVQLPEGRVSLPAWDVAGKQVWGLTYLMVKNLFALLSPSAAELSPCP